MHYRFQFYALVLWRSLPALLIGAMIVLMHIPALPAALVAALWPCALLSLIYWILRFPAHANYGFLFALGMLEDALAGTVPGLHALLFLGLRVIIEKGPREAAEGGFVIMWAYSSLLLALSLTVEWLLVNYYYNHIYPLSPVLLYAGMGMLLYPALHLGCLSLERRFHRRWWFMLGR